MAIITSIWSSVKDVPSSGEDEDEKCDESAHSNTGGAYLWSEVGTTVSTDTTGTHLTVMD